MLRAALATTAAMLILAFADLPYGFYQMLRIVCTATLAWLMITIWEKSPVFERSIIILLAISYNPIFKIHMERDVHAIVNFVTVAVVAVVYFRHRKTIENA